MARRGELQDVELLEEGDDRADEEAEPGAAPARRSRRTALIAVALVVVVTLAGAQWFVTARERAAIAALATLPGVLAPVDEHLDVERRVPADDAAELFGYAGGSLKRAADGSQSFTAAAGPGPPRCWDRPPRSPSTTPTTSSPAATACPTTRPARTRAPPAPIVCLVSDGGLVFDMEADDGSLVRVPATTTQVMVLSAADGTIAASWPVDVGDAPTVFAVLDDAVAIASTATTGTTVDPARRAHRRLTLVALEPDPRRRGDHRGRVLERRPVPGGRPCSRYAPREQPLTLIAADGTVVRELPGTIGDGFGLATDERGRLTVQSMVDGQQRTILLADDADPAHDVTVDGNLAYAVLDDGSVPGLLLTYDTELHAWDRSTGEERWSDDTVVSASSVLIMRGRVFVLTSRVVAAFDGDSGRKLWATTAEDGVAPSTISTDGRHLLVTLEPTLADASPALVAYDPASGTEVFRSPYPAGVGNVSPINGRLVGIDTTTDGNDFSYVLLR